MKFKKFLKDKWKSHKDYEKKKEIKINGGIKAAAKFHAQDYMRDNSKEIYAYIDVMIEAGKEKQALRLINKFHDTDFKSLKSVKVMIKDFLKDKSKKRGEYRISNLVTDVTIYLGSMALSALLIEAMGLEPLLSGCTYSILLPVLIALMVVGVLRKQTMGNPYGVDDSERAILTPYRLAKHAEAGVDARERDA